MMGTTSVAGIWRYPLKSAPGERLPDAFLGANGIPGDRGWALIDAESGHIGSAKLPRVWGELLRVSPRYREEPAEGSPPPTLEITLPDGTVTDSTRADADAMISRAIGHPARLSSTPPAERLVTREWPDIDGMAMRATESTGGSGLAAPGTFFDHAPVHVLTTASLAALAAAMPGTDADPRRFRPTLLLDTGDASGFLENDWTGRLLTIGDVQLRVLGPSPRCVVVTLPHGELPRDLDILRGLVAANRIPFEEREMAMPCIGAYAAVEHPGRVHEGDSVTLA
jgi:uncharacterized protein YcbX